MKNQSNEDTATDHIFGCTGVLVLVLLLVKRARVPVLLFNAWRRNARLPPVGLGTVDSGLPVVAIVC